MYNVLVLKFCETTKSRRNGTYIKGGKKKLVWWWVEARICAQPCLLSALRARSCGGGYWIQMRPVSSLRSGRYRWKCSYQYRLSEPDSGLIRLIDDFRCSCPPLPLCLLPEEPWLINVWVTVVFPYWYLDWWPCFSTLPLLTCWKVTRFKMFGGDSLE